MSNTAIQVIVQFGLIRMIESTDFYIQPVSPINENYKGSK